MAKKNDLKALIAQAAEQEDQTQVVTSGDFEYDPPKAGLTVGRFIEYIELGVHPQKAFKGKAKKDIEKVRITFELTHPKNVKEIEKEDKTTVKIADKITVTLPKSFHEKAKFRKLFDKMRYGREDIKHFAQMLGEGFKITVVHNESEKDGTKKVYANIQGDDGSWLVEPPIVVDPITETSKTLAVPEAISELRLFLWNNPTKACWDSLFIDGEREVKDEKGGSKTVSKNWLQNMIKSAKNFKDSALADLLDGSDQLNLDEPEVEESEAESAELATLDDLPTEEDVEAVVEDAKKRKAAPAKKSVASVKAAPAQKKTATAAKPSAKTASPSKAKAKTAPTDDPLAALGLLG